MASTITETVTLEVSDGTRMQAHMARPDTAGSHAGLLIFQEAFGVNPHIRDVTERFAGEGYVAIAPELYHRAAPGFNGSYDDLDSAIAQATQLTREGLVADIEASYGWLNDNGATSRRRIGCVGFCMGGRVAVLASATVPLGAAVSYYGGVTPTLPELVPRIQAPMLFYWGGLDKHIPAEQHHQFTLLLKEAGKEYVDVEFSNADHGFFCDDRPVYNRQAASESWALTLAFLKNHL
jgi:carboxymethylenebutenolidase